MSNYEHGAKLYRFSVGYDSILSQINNLNPVNYPPHNIVKISDDRYLIEYAVAGFAKEDIFVSQEDGYLIVRGVAPEDDERNYVHKGISGRDFINRIRLADHVEVVDAEMKNGLLTVALERIIPDELKPRKIDIK